VKTVLGIDVEVKIEVKPYKTKRANIDLRRRILVVNSYLLELGEDVAKFLVLHELVHLRIQTLNRNAEFQALINRYAEALGIDSTECRSKIARRLLEISGFMRQTRQR